MPTGGKQADSSGSSAQAGQGGFEQGPGGSGAAVSHHTAPLWLGDQDAKGTQVLQWC